MVAQIFSLSTKNVERLLNKRNPESVELLEALVAKKLVKRATYVQGCHIPLVNHLVFKITDEKTPVPRTAPDLRVTSKVMPDRFSLFQHVVDEYLLDRAQLLETAVPGGVYFKAVMRQRADTRARHRRERAEARRRQLEHEMRTSMSHRRNDAKKDDDSGSDNDEPVQQAKLVIHKPVNARKSEVKKPAVNQPVITVETESIPALETKRSDAFLTEVAAKYSEIPPTPKTSSRRNWSRRENHHHMKVEDNRPDMLRHQSFHTVCLVYDEDEHKSKVVHSGQLTLTDSQPAAEPALPLAPAYPDDVPKTPSDARMVGAPAHMDSRENSRQSSRRSQRAVVEIVTQKPSSGRVIHFPLPPLSEGKKPTAGDAFADHDHSSLADDVTILAGNLGLTETVNLPKVDHKSSYRLGFTTGDDARVPADDVHRATAAAVPVTASLASDNNRTKKMKKKDRAQTKLQVHQELGLPKIEVCEYL